VAERAFGLGGANCKINNANQIIHQRFSNQAERNMCSGCRGCFSSAAPFIQPSNVHKQDAPVVQCVLNALRSLSAPSEKDRCVFLLVDLNSSCPLLLLKKPTQLLKRRDASWSISMWSENICSVFCILFWRLKAIFNHRWSNFRPYALQNIMSQALYDDHCAIQEAIH
jgi:hypothetical protein